MDQPGIFFEDIVLEQPLVSAPYLLHEHEMIDFARQWDPQPYHTDADAAAQFPLGQLFASGVHLIAICCKLAQSTAPHTQALAGMGWDTLRFEHPAFAGDQLRCEHWAENKRRSNSRPDTGIVTYRMRLLNQHERLLLSYTVTCLIACRPHTTA